jgi:hypothetical protein
MAEPEELDEDLFADLYAHSPHATTANPVSRWIFTDNNTSYEGDDTPAKPAQPPPASQSEVSEHLKTEPTDQSATESATNGAQAADSGGYGHQDAGFGDADMGGGDWNGNGNQSYDAPAVEQDDNYGPINVKEDG